MKSLFRLFIFGFFVFSLLCPQLTDCARAADEQVINELRTLNTKYMQAFDAYRTERARAQPDPGLLASHYRMYRIYSTLYQLKLDQHPELVVRIGMPNIAEDISSGDDDDSVDLGPPTGGTDVPPPGGDDDDDNSGDDDDDDKGSGGTGVDTPGVSDDDDDDGGLSDSGGPGDKPGEIPPVIGDPGGGADGESPDDDDDNSGDDNSGDDDDDDLVYDDAPGSGGGHAGDPGTTPDERGTGTNTCTDGGDNPGTRQPPPHH